MRAGKRSAKKFYAVQHGRNGYKGVLGSWPECQRVVHGVSSARFKSFKTYAQAAAFAHAAGSAQFNSSTDEGRNGGQSSVELDPDAMIIYTDGACTKNGRIGSRAGVGVYFGEGCEHNISEPLEGEKQTNQRAEMTAIIRALETICKRTDIVSKSFVINTDSTYTRKGFYEWMPKWKTNKWKSSNKTDVLNQDLWVALDEAAKEAERKGFKFQIKWVRGHAGEHGNEMADQLAVAGASL